MPLTKYVVVWCLALLVCLVAVAQEESGSAPPVAGTSVDDTGVASREEDIPDTRPLTGAEPFTLGAASTSRSFLTTSFNVSETADTNSSSLGNDTNVNAVTNLSGTVHLQRVWTRSQLGLDYTGGTTLNNTDSDFNAMYHQLGIGHTLKFRRWILSLRDDLLYSPESSFGYYGTGLFGPGVNPNFVPNQSIVTPHSSRINNTALVQADVMVGRGSSLTVAGSVALLRFVGDPPVGVTNVGIDSRQERFQFGYNRPLGRRNVLGISYGLDFLHFEGSSRRIDTHNVHLSFGRRITGRMAIQLSGGPQIARSNVAGTDSNVNWSAQAAMTYRFARTSLNVSYWHSINAGAGVFAGARTHSVEATLGQRLTRTLTANLHGGYARNSSLTGLINVPVESTFDTEYLGVGFSKPLGRQASIFFNYNLQHQSGNDSVCAGTVCSATVLRHVFGIGFSWHMRPILLGR